MSWLIITEVAGVAALAFSLTSHPNGLTRRRDQREKSWSKADVQFERRLDPIPEAARTAHTVEF